MMMTKNSTPTIKGNQIGPWKLGETLGLGSTGKVQLAQNKITDKQAAIKIISKSIFNSQTNLNNASSIASNVTPDSLPYGIEREIIIMKLLNHPNVLRLYDVWETNTNLYMVLEYAEKGELFNLLVERGPLPENEAIRFFRQIIIGISYCHALGIVHRDLKPENLLLDHKFNIKIADFGMAALETEDKLLETSCGSPHYAAPEIVSGIPYHGFASDVWSCGVILFALLTGRLPFDEEDGNIRNLLLKVQSGHFEMPEDDEISREAQDLIKKILVVDPEKRIKARDILKHPLLQKYPSIKDSKSIRNLPREDTYLHPLAETKSVIDKNILQNLVVLWHGRDSAEIEKKLNEKGANAEKTLYALLHRFKLDTEHESMKNEQLKKRQSLTSSSISNSVNKSPKKISTPQRRKNRASVISVSSSHKRPVSINRLSSVIHNTSASSSNQTTPGSNRKLSSANKRLSMMSMSTHKNGSPSPAPRNKRASIINNDRQSILKNKRASRASKRLSMLPNFKRGSITTKLIATYAKLSEDDDWEYIEQETKRTSSDFATLIDEIFEHEKYEQIRKEKEELARKVKEAKEREEAEKKKQKSEEIRLRKEREEMERKQRKIHQEMEEEIENLKKDIQDTDKADFENDNIRSVSAPLQNTDEADEKLLRQRNFSLQTRPISRLDPGLFFEEKVKPAPVTAESRNMKTEKIILETIRRSRFLGSSYDINSELRNVKVDGVKTQRQPERMFSNATATYETQVLPKHAVATAPLRGVSEGTRKISEVKVPQFTRKSRNFSESSRRLSVLSMYSTKQSYTNLADIVKTNDEKADFGQRTPTPASAGDSEFLFETVNEEAEFTGNSSTDDKLFEVQEDNENEKKSHLKLSFSDRFDETKKAGENFEAKLPILPPLDSKQAGLGIYQSPSSPVENKQATGQEKIKSMIPEDSQKNASREELNEDDNRKHNDIKAVNEVNIPKKRETVDIPKKSSVSFLRKISGAGPADKSKAPIQTVLKANVPAKQMFNGLENLLRGWTKYGLKNVKPNATHMKIDGKLANDNILSLRSTVFNISVTGSGKSSVVTITKKSGSSKAVKRLANEIQNVLNKEGVLQQ